MLMSTEWPYQVMPERKDKGLIMNTQEWKIKIHTFIRQTDNVKVEQ